MKDDFLKEVIVEFDIVGLLYFDGCNRVITRYSYNNIPVMDLDTLKRVSLNNKKMVIVDALKHHIPCNKIPWMISESKRRFMSLVEIVNYETY